MGSAYVNWSGTYVFSLVLIYVHVHGALKLSPIVKTADGWWLPIVLKALIKKKGGSDSKVWRQKYCKEQSR